MIAIRVEPTDISCGINQAFDLVRSTPTDILRASDDVAFIIFSDVARRGSNGRRLERDISKEGLGIVTRSGRARNPNTGNLIEMFVWELNAAAKKIIAAAAEDDDGRYW